MKFRDELPHGCPPPEASSPHQGQKVYRIIEGDSIVESDLTSHFTRGILARPKQFTECQYKGISVWETKEKVTQLLLTAKFKEKRACEIVLTPQCGKIQQTSGPYHHTFWPSTNFQLRGDWEVFGT